jgi:tol-pal system beta propeller repeat protein TolB
MMRSIFFAGLAAAALSGTADAGAQQRAASAAQPQRTVLVLPVTNDPYDSIRTILQRNLDHGGRVEVRQWETELLRPLVEGASPPVLRRDSVWQLGARYVLRVQRVRDSLRVTVYDSIPADPTTRSLHYPSIGQPRGGIVYDSLLRAFELRETAARARLEELGARYDSLLRASRGRQPRNAEQRAREVARRDSIFQAIAAESPQIHAAILRAPVERDSLIRLLVPREVTRYDSLLYAQRMWLHSAADEIQRWLTGAPGVAASRIAFVRNGLLHVVDSDGANERVLTRAGRALSPAWHPSGRWIVYADINDRGTQIAEVDVGTGEVRYVSATQRGYNITPVYSPDGRHIVFAAGGTGATQLVSYDRRTARLTRLGADTRNASSPHFSPDGRRMTFVVPRPWTGSGPSTRMTPQVFVSNADGSRLQQLTPSQFGVRSYRTSPEWSPDGRRIAYTQQGGGFQIWVIGVEDRRARQVTRGVDHDGASWAPDGRHIVVTAGRDETKLLVVDVDTGRTRELPLRPGARLPAWGPRWTPEQPVALGDEIYAAGAK